MNPITLFAAVIGGAAGFAYWKYVGCITGTCPIQTNPWLSTGFGVLIGTLILPGLLQKLRPADASAQPPAAQWRNIDADTFRRIAGQEEVLILDVRTPAEHAERAIPGSILIDINRPDFAERVAELDTTKTVLVYCRTGRRSAAAADVLVRAGFREVLNLRGGIVSY